MSKKKPLIDNGYYIVDLNDSISPYVINKVFNNREEVQISINLYLKGRFTYFTGRYLNKLNIKRKNPTEYKLGSKYIYPEKYNQSPLRKQLFRTKFRRNLRRKMAKEMGIILTKRSKDKKKYYKELNKLKFL